MALVLKDRVFETSTTSGTGTLTLAGALDNFQTFSSAIGNGNTTYYTIVDDTIKQWEVGVGTVGASTLSRDTVLASSNGGAKVNFSVNAKQVFCDYPAGKSVYTDASGNISNLAGSISKPTFIEFDQTYATALSAGQLGWDGNNTLAVGMAGGNVVQHIGEDSYFYIKASSAITKGQLVMFTGAVGASGVLTGAPSTGVTIGSYIMGVAAENIANNGFGLVQCFGELTNVNTNAFNEGDILYYDSTVTGGLTSTFPTSGPIVVVAAVAKKSAGGGVIYIRVSVTQRITAGTGISVSQTNTGTVITNTSPSSGGTVTNVSGTAPIAVANGTTTPTVSIPKASASADGYLSSTDWSTFNNKGSGSVTSVGGTGTVSGISLSGTVTSSGNLTLGGALDLSAPPAIGGTTPNNGTFTTITGQTEVLKGTGQNLLTQSSVLTNAAWGVSNLTVTGSQSDPFGGTTASLLNSGTATGTHLLSETIVYPSNTYTYSCYAKAGTANFIGIYIGGINQGVIFNLTTGAFSANINGAPTSYAATNIGLPTGWWRVSIVFTGIVSTAQLLMSENGTSFSFTGTSQTVTVSAPQLEIGSTLGTYQATTSSIVYGTPTLSFSGVAGLGLQSDGSLYVSPAGTGALQAQATDSGVAGGNARGANAIDWQTNRASATRVASGSYAVLSGGSNNYAQGNYSTTVGGNGNGISSAGTYSAVLGGYLNILASPYSAIVGGYTNGSATQLGQFNFIGGGALNTGTATAAVTTQAATMNGTTAVTLSGSNAAIKVGQYITGTAIATGTYVAAISGTSLTLSQNASGSGSATLSFFTPHGVVVGGGNNQATGAYSFIGGGGDAGTAANRNVASGDWSFVGGGRNNTASGAGSFVGGGGYYNGLTSTAGNTASGDGAFIGAGFGNSAQSFGSSVLGGNNNTANALYSGILGSQNGTTRAIVGNTVSPASATPIGTPQGSAQSALLVLGRQTTDATPTVLASNSSAAGTTNQVILPNNSAYYFKIEVIAGVTGAGNTKAWELKGAIKRGANAGTTAIVGTVTTTVIATDAGAATWTVTATADTTNGGIAVTVTGQASTTIRWVARCTTAEMTY